MHFDFCWPFTDFTNQWRRCILFCEASLSQKVKPLGFFFFSPHEFPFFLHILAITVTLHFCLEMSFYDVEQARSFIVTFTLLFAVSFQWTKQKRLSGKVWITSSCAWNSFSSDRECAVAAFDYLRKLTKCLLSSWQSILLFTQAETILIAQVSFKNNLRANMKIASALQLLFLLFTFTSEEIDQKLQFIQHIGNTKWDQEHDARIPLHKALNICNFTQNSWTTPPGLLIIFRSVKRCVRTSRFPRTLYSLTSLFGDTLFCAQILIPDVQIFIGVWFCPLDQIPVHLHRHCSNATDRVHWAFFGWSNHTCRWNWTEPKFKILRQEDYTCQLTWISLSTLCWSSVHSKDQRLASFHSPIWQTAEYWESVAL